MNQEYLKLSAVLQEKLTEGWKEFVEGIQFPMLRDFAFFLEASEEFQTKHRGKLPHPAHEYAARHIGKPFMDQLVKLGLHLDFWFPGNFEISKETQREEYEKRQKINYSSDEEVAIRTFFSTLLKGGGEKICKISISFPHLHDGFGFPVPPHLEIVECYLTSNLKNESFYNLL